MLAACSSYKPMPSCHCQCMGMLVFSANPDKLCCNAHHLFIPPPNAIMLLPVPGHVGGGRCNEEVASIAAQLVRICRESAVLLTLLGICWFWHGQGSSAACCRLFILQPNAIMLLPMRAHVGDGRWYEQAVSIAAQLVRICRESADFGSPDVWAFAADRGAADGAQPEPAGEGCCG